MGGQQHGQCALAGEAAHRIENPQLVAEIEARGWFVEDQDSRLLSQGAGDERELPFAAADPQPLAFGEVVDPERRDRLVGGVAIRARRRRERAAMCGAPHQYDLPHGKRKAANAALRDIAEAERPAAGVPARDCLPIDANRAGERRQQTEDGLEQGRLAFAVAPEHAQHLAGADRKTDMMPDAMPAITVTQVLDQQAWRAHHHAGRRLKARTHRNTGVPSAAVNTPSGSSTVPKLRASVSTASR